MNGPSASKLERAIDLLWIACALVIPFQRVWTLPLTGNKLQPPELVALLLIAAATVYLWRGHRPTAFAWIDLGTFAWWAAVTVVWLILTARGQSSRPILLAWIGTTYLWLFYLALRVTASPERVRRSVSSLVWMGILATAASILGFVVAAIFGYRMPNVLMVDFPYLGRAIRASGFTANPAMAASVIITALFAWIMLRIIEPRHALARAWVPALLVASFAITQAKVGVALVCGVLVYVLFRTTRIWWRVTLLTACVLLAAIFTVGSHAVIIRADEDPAVLDSLVLNMYIAEAPLAVVRVAGTDLAVFRSNYWMNKRASIYAIQASWPIGLGHGGQIAFVDRLMKEGRHPTTMWAADPHSTYTGAIAELGLAGAVALATLAACLIADVRRVRQALDPSVAAIGMVLSAALVTVAIECSTTDVMNFRHYWLDLALIASLSTYVDTRLDERRKSL